MDYKIAYLKNVFYNISLEMYQGLIAKCKNLYLHLQTFLIQNILIVNIKLQEFPKPFKKKIFSHFFGLYNVVSYVIVHYLCVRMCYYNKQISTVIIAAISYALARQAPGNSQYSLYMNVVTFKSSCWIFLECSIKRKTLSNYTNLRVFQQVFYVF